MRTTATRTLVTQTSTELGVVEETTARPGDAPACVTPSVAARQPSLPLSLGSHGRFARGDSCVGCAAAPARVRLRNLRHAACQKWRAGHTHFNLLHMHAQAARTERQPAGTVPRARPMRAKGPTRLPKAPGRPRRCASVWDHGTGRAAARSLLPPSTGMPQQPLAILDIPALASHQHAAQ